VTMTEGSTTGSATELDRDLFDALAFAPPPAATAAATQRVAAAIVLASTMHERRGHRSNGFLARLVLSIRGTARRRRAVALLFAVLILGGAGRGLLGLYEGMVGPEGSARTAWDRATIVGASQTHDGYRVTIERAYADANVLMLAISVHDLQNRGWTQVSAMGATATDERGDSFAGSMSMSSPDGPSVAANVAWFTSPPGLTPGQHTLSISVPAVSVRDTSTPPPAESPGVATGEDSWTPWHEVAGPWRFTVPLTVGGGSMVHPQSSASVGGTEVRLTEVTVSPASVTGTIAVSGAAGGGQWLPVGQVEHAGHTYALHSGVLGPDAAITFQASDGTTQTSGEWTLRINELVGSDGTQQVRLAGPWVLTFWMP